VISAKTPPRPSCTPQAASSRMPRRPRCSALIRRQGLQRIREPSGAATCPYPCQDGPSRGRWACPGRLHGPCWLCHAARRAGLLTRRAGCRRTCCHRFESRNQPPGMLGDGYSTDSRPAPPPRTRSDAATAVLGWASSTARPRTTPLTAPSSAPTTTGTDRDGKAIGPQSLQTRTHSSLGCRSPVHPNEEEPDLVLSLKSSPGQRPCIAASAIVQVGRSQGTHQPDPANEG